MFCMEERWLHVLIPTLNNYGQDVKKWVGRVYKIGNRFYEIRKA